MNTEADYAWAAGLFEGEGCFSSSSNKVGGEVQYPRAYLSMTDFDIIERFRDVIGFGTLKVKKAQGRSRRQLTWCANSFEDFQATVALLWKWLGPRRRARARELLLIRAQTPHRLRGPRSDGRWHLPGSHGNEEA